MYQSGELGKETPGLEEVKGSGGEKSIECRNSLK